MRKHTKIYFDYFDIGYDESGYHDFISCEMCGCESVDIHHIIPRSQNGKDAIENLIALCRDCHTKAHDEKITKLELQVKHSLNMIGLF